MARREAASGLLVILAGLGCATSPPPARVAGASAGEIRLAAELLAAVDAQQLTSAVLDRALGSRSTTVRRAAALAIGQSRSRALRPRLHALVADADSGVAANAAFAAGLLADTTAVPALQAALARGGPTAVEAAWALGEIGGPARDALTAALVGATDPGREATVAAELLLAAAKLRPVPVAAIVPHASSRHGSVREAAAYAVGRSRVSGGVRILLGLAADPSSSTRASVARGLARSAAGDSLGTRAVAVLARLVADPEPAVRIAAVRSLASYGPVPPATAAALWRDPDPNVRVAAAEVAAELLGSATPVTWEAVWNADSAHGFRRALLAAAAPSRRLDRQASVWGRDASWARRAAAASAAGRSSDGAIAPLEPALRDGDPRVRTAALSALGSTLDSAAAPEPIRRRLSAALADSDAVVRAAAIDALAASPRASDAAAMRSAYRRASTDRDADARVAALRYLVDLWRIDSAAIAPAERAWLRGLPQPRDPLERALAAPLPAASGWAGASATPPRGLDWYENVVQSLVLPARRGRATRAVLWTVRGPITIELHAAEAPLTVANFVALAGNGYYTRTRFHRVVPAFVVQDGDPRGDGNGGPGYAIRDEQNRRRYHRGVVGMALSGPNTGGSQYYIALTDQPHLAGHYTAFGHVVAGENALDRVVEGDAIDSVTVAR